MKIEWKCLIEWDLFTEENENITFHIDETRSKASCCWAYKVLFPISSQKDFHIFHFWCCTITVDILCPLCVRSRLTYATSLAALRPRIHLFLLLHYSSTILTTTSSQRKKIDEYNRDNWHLNLFRLLCKTIWVQLRLQERFLCKKINVSNLLSYQRHVHRFKLFIAFRTQLSLFIYDFGVHCVMWTVKKWFIFNLWLFPTLRCSSLSSTPPPLV